MKIKHWIKIIASSSTVTALAFFSIANSSAKEYYKWVDSKGSTHYTSTPPPKNAKKKGKVDTYGWRGETTPSSSSSPSPENQQVPVPSSNQNSSMDQQQREANEALRRVDPVTDSRSSDAPR